MFSFVHKESCSILNGMRKKLNSVFFFVLSMVFIRKTQNKVLKGKHLKRKSAFLKKDNGTGHGYVSATTNKGN